MSWQRAVFLLALAVVEATPVVVLLTVLGTPMWPLLISVVLLGALSDWAILRWQPDKQQMLLPIAAILIALGVSKTIISGQIGPFSGWGSLVGLFLLTGTNAYAGYVGLVGSLYAFWRGLNLRNQSVHTTRDIFLRNTAVIVAIAMLSLVTGRVALSQASMATAEVVIFFMVGLITIALAGAIEASDAARRRLDGRGFLMLVGVVMLITAIGFGLASLVSDQIAQVITWLWGTVLVVVAVVFAPIFLLFAYALSWLFQWADFDGFVRQIAQLQQQMAAAGQNAQSNQSLASTPAWVAPLGQGICLAVPIVVLLLCVILLRRRAVQRDTMDETRESVFDWQGFTNDLRGLFARRRPAEAGGLQAALAAMRGTDPASRIRRSYIRLLLQGERREQPRASFQTPREYAPVVGGDLPPAKSQVVELTRAYEVARYHPDAATDAAANRAEQSASAIERAAKAAPPRRAE